MCTADGDAAFWSDTLVRCALDAPTRSGIVTIEVDWQPSNDYIWRKTRAAVHNATRKDRGDVHELPTAGGAVIVLRARTLALPT